MHNIGNDWEEAGRPRSKDKVGVGTRLSDWRGGAPEVIRVTAGEADRRQGRTATVSSKLGNCFQIEAYFNSGLWSSNFDSAMRLTQG